MRIQEINNMCAKILNMSRSRAGPAARKNADSPAFLHAVDPIERAQIETVNLNFKSSYDDVYDVCPITEIQTSRKS